MLPTGGIDGLRSKATRSDVIRERYLRGHLKYKLHSGQLVIREKFKSMHDQLFVAECARQFGKSYYFVLECIELAFKMPKARVKYATAYHTDLVEFIMPNFVEILKDCPEDIKPKFKVQGSKWVFRNGSEIKLVGLDLSPDGLRGNAIDLVVLDEAGFISGLDYIYKSVLIPATTHRPHCKIVMISTPASTPAHDFTDFCEKAELEGNLVTLTIHDNPRVDETNKLRLMKESGGEDSTTWKREYLCLRIIDADLAIIPEFKPEHIYEVTPDHFTPFYHRYVAMDMGVSDLTALLFGYYDFMKAKLVILDEFVINGPKLTTKVLEGLIREKEYSLWKKSSPYKRISDNNNPLLLQDLAAERTDGTTPIYFQATNKAELKQMVNAVRIMCATDSIVIHPRCKYTWGSLKSGVWNKTKTQFARSKVYGHFDALAALVYLVRNLNTTTNPIPPTFLVDQNNTLILNRQHQSQTAKNFKKAFEIKRNVS